MKRIFTTVVALGVAACSYSQQYLPLTAGPSTPLSGDLYQSGNDVVHYLGDGLNKAAIKGSSGRLYMYTGSSSYNLAATITENGTFLIGGTSVPYETAWLGTSVIGREGYDKVILGTLSSTYTGATIGGHNSALNAWGDLNINGTAIILRIAEAENVRFTQGSSVFAGSISASGRILAPTGSNGGFETSTYSAGHNNIWRFGNAPEYGMGYYQGTGHPWGTDAIGFHFGDRNSPKFYVQNNGNATIAGSMFSNGRFSSSTGSNGGFENYSYTAGHNNIWRLGTEPEYGMGYYQGSGYSWGTDAIGFHFGDRNAPKFYVQNNGNATLMGNMGIGIMASPDVKLAVAGKIRATEIKVEALPWPDYVFEKEYHLKPLPEIEKFIAENKHLPEIPSAKSVAAEGVNLGEMQAKLLQKIEELTLYLIEQNKEIKQLKIELLRSNNK